MTRLPRITVGNDRGALGRDLAIGTSIPSTSPVYRLELLRTFANRALHPSFHPLLRPRRFAPGCNARGVQGSCGSLGNTDTTRSQSPPKPWHPSRSNQVKTSAPHHIRSASHPPFYLLSRQLNPFCRPTVLAPIPPPAPLSPSLAFFVSSFPSLVCFIHRYLWLGRSGHSRYLLPAHLTNLGSFSRAHL
jgi:hypothetical protein